MLDFLNTLLCNKRNVMTSPINNFLNVTSNKVQTYYNTNYSRKILEIQKVIADDDVDHVTLGTKSILSNSKRPIDEILNNFVLDRIQLIKSFKDDNKEIKTELSTNNNSLGIDVKGTWNNEELTTYFGLNVHDFSLGLKYKFSDLISTDFGFKQNSSSNKTLFVSGEYNHPFVFINTTAESSFIPFKDPSSLNISATFSHKLKAMSLLTGFSLKTPSSSNFSTANLYKTASFSVVASNGMVRFDIKPGDILLTTCAWKINENYEVAARIHNNWKLTSWSNEFNELGLLHKLTNSQTLGLKADIGGRLTIGSWWKKERIKLGLSAQTNLKNTENLVNYGLVFEFQ